MKAEEYPLGNGFETNSEHNNPWDEISENPPEFAGDLGDGINEDETKSDTDHYTFEGVEYRRIDEIDISSEEGKLEWLSGLLKNGALYIETGLDNIESGDENINKKSQLDFIKRQQSILERIGTDKNEDIIDILRKDHSALHDKLDELIDNGGSTQADIDETFEDYSATFNLLGLVESESARRDPNYFGQNEMENILKNKVAQAERGVKETMISGYIGEDGLIHATENGGSLPSAATENAKILLKEAEQDAEVFDRLMGIYDDSLDYQAPRAIKKKDFIPTIKDYVEGHDNQLKQLETELTYLTKGTTEYLDKEAEIKRQRQHRDAAERLLITYFGNAEE